MYYDQSRLASASERVLYLDGVTELHVGGRVLRGQLDNFSFSAPGVISLSISPVVEERSDAQWYTYSRGSTFEVRGLSDFSLLAGGIVLAVAPGQSIAPTKFIVFHKKGTLKMPVPIKVGV